MQQIKPMEKGKIYLNIKKLKAGLIITTLLVVISIFIPFIHSIKPEEIITAFPGFNK